MKNKKGFTLMELVIVLAVLAIIAAILIPTFLTTTDRARLRSDVQSTHVINNAMELYRVENNEWPGDTISAVLSRLYETGYLRSAMTTNGTQTNGAVWELETAPATAGQPAVRRVLLNISAAAIPDSVHRMANDLPAGEIEFVTGRRTSS